MLMGAEGLNRVTMRRLAQELDTGAASLYVYVRNTAELHAAILDDLLGGLDLSPVKAAGDWRTRLETILRSYTALLLEHPGLAQSALVARPSGPNYLDLCEALLALLHQGGVPVGQAAWGLDLLLQLGTATAAEHAIEAPDEDWRALDSAVRDISPATHPHLAAIGADLLSGPPQARLSWGLQAVIDGTLHTLREH
ncbi:TetR/AcrR family transcriptional regulator C-terminal domain-containing protein [Fodinicola feengrottensis]|uniref:TetR/AcrR family transcriptional regulator C-terminal domain-containing protein n=2 Tax=Fodinicola feengrottensis TaxID=435914 RepID=A0ABP4TUN0_9ACTN